MDAEIRINSISNNLFLYRTMEVPAIYHARKNTDGNIDIVCIYRENNPFAKNVEFSRFNIDSKVPASAEEAVTLLNRVIFKNSGDSNSSGIIVLTQAEFDALNGVFQQNIPYYITN